MATSSLSITGQTTATHSVTLDSAGSQNVGKEIRWFYRVYFPAGGWVSGGVTACNSTQQTYSKFWSGLSPSTTYQFDADFYYTDGTYIGTNTDYGTTWAPPMPGPPSSPVAVSSRIEGGFVLTWGSASDATSYVLSYKNTYDPSYSEVVVPGTSYTLTGRPYGVTHDFFVRGRNAQGDSYYSSDTHHTTAPRSPTDISAINVTSTSFTIVVNTMSGNWDYINVSVNQGGNQVQIKQIYNRSNSVAFTGLQPNVEYTVYTRSYFDNFGELLSSVNAGSISVLTSRPANFAWQYSTIVSGQPAIVDHRDWNALTQRINDFRNYKGLPNYSFTTVSAGDFYASVFNQAVNAISAMSPPTSPPGTKLGLSDVLNPMDADDVLAADFYRLRDSLNSIP